MISSVNRIVPPIASGNGSEVIVMNERQRILLERRLWSLRQQLVIAALQVNDRAEVLDRVRELESIASIIQQAEDELEQIKDELEQMSKKIAASE
jgi:hypothetical protein